MNSEVLRRARALLTLDNILISSTLATLCYIRVLRWVIFLSGADLFFCNILPNRTELATACIAMCVLTAMILPLVGLARRDDPDEHIIARCLFLATVALAIASVLSVLPVRLKMALSAELGAGAWQALRSVLIGALLVWMFARRHRSVRAACAVLSLLSPFAAITFGRAMFRSISEPTVLAPVHAHELSHHTLARQRLIWIIFDEWDYRLTFAERPDGLKLDMVDGLTAGALSAEAAVPPAGYTLLSVPALLSGRSFSRFDPVSADAALIERAGEKGERDYRNEGSIFAEARSLGYTTGAAGWYLPYCRLFGADLDGCEWSGAAYYLTYPSIPPSYEGSIVSPLLTQAQVLLATNAVPFGIGERRRRDYARDYRILLKRGIDMSSDARFDFVFLHIPAPHLPGICGDFMASCPSQDYLGNLKIMDAALSEICQALRSQGLWDHTALLISSDHPFRGAADVDGRTDSRVPFIVRVPGAHQGISYHPKFNTVLSKDLALFLLSRAPASLVTVKRWLDEHATGSGLLNSEVKGAVLASGSGL